MNEFQNSKTMVPQDTNDDLMVPPGEEQRAIMVPPKPISGENLNVSGGESEQSAPHGAAKMPEPPQMKVVELKDGGFVSVPESAICETKEDAEKYMIPPPPPIFHHRHHNHWTDNDHRCQDHKCRHHQQDI